MTGRVPIAMASVRFSLKNPAQDGKIRMVMPDMKSETRKSDRFETLLYHQRRAHKAWMGRATLQQHAPSDEAAELVWELLVTYGEAVEDFDSAREDITKTAYELAGLVLGELSIGQVFEIYRDSLLDAMMDFAIGSVGAQCRTLVYFSNCLSSAFCEAHSDLLKRTIRHNRAESLSNELRLAKSIQSHLLPKVIPQIPGFEFAGRLLPADEVGGDYWSIKHYPEDGVVTMKLADISGHGVAAATLVAAVKFISGGYYRGADSAADVMRHTNRVLTRETPHDVLVTMVYGWLRPESFELTLVNAGHAPVFVCRENECADVPATGPVLGVSETVEYEEKVFRLTKDDIVFFGSDGITEAGIGEPFGTERLKKLVAANAGKCADEIADTVVRTVTEYARHPHDDISLLVVKVTGEPDNTP